MATAALILSGAACADDDDTDNGEGTNEESPAGAADTDGELTGGAGDPDDGAADVVFGTGGSWTVEHIEQLTVDETNTAPVIDRELADDPIDPEYWLWDWWPIRDRDGDPADFDGWQVAIALAAPSNLLPGQRHDVAELRYLLSDDGGETWKVGDALYEEGSAEGSRQWAGSAMYDEEEGLVYSFYTAAGETGERHQPPTVDELRAAEGDAPESENGVENGDENGEGQPTPSGGGYVTDEDISFEQRAVVARAEVNLGGERPEFVNWSEHQILFEGDGELYAATADTEGGAGEIDAFRDPEYFRDPATGQEYLLFTATMPVAECPGDGVVGIAQRSADDTDLTDWEVLPPLLDGHCVNNELERPHMVVSDGQYHLLFTTHAHTFDEGLDGPEGLYGFVAPALTGPYEPLNGSGLVLANPPEEPYQAYSWLVLPNGLATSFFQYWGIEPDQELDYIGAQDIEFQLERFGGTFAPSVEIVFEGDTTRVGQEFAPGQIRR